MTTVTTHRPDRARYAVVLAVTVAVILAIVIAVTAYAVTTNDGTKRPTPVTTVTRASQTATPGDGLLCPIHQSC